MFVAEHPITVWAMHDLCGWKEGAKVMMLSALPL